MLQYCIIILIQFFGLLLLAVSLAILFGPKDSKNSREWDPNKIFSSDFWYMEAWMRISGNNENLIFRLAVPNCLTCLDLLPSSYSFNSNTDARHDNHHFQSSNVLRIFYPARDSHYNRMHQGNALTQVQQVSNILLLFTKI